MEDEARVSGGGGEIYWLDAREDISCDLIDDFVGFDRSVVQESIDNGVNNDFFGGIDHILDSIKNGGGLPPVEKSNFSGSGVQDSRVPQNNFQISGNGYCGNDTGSGVPQWNGLGNNTEGETEKLGDREITVLAKENGLQKNSFRRNEASKERDFDKGERVGKRARVCSYKNERNNFMGRGQLFSVDRDRSLNRKRPHVWDEGERGHGKRRDYYNNGSHRRDCRDREPRGYWVRDKLGENEMVYRVGTWEANHDRDSKDENGKNQEGDGKVESKPDDLTEKVVEEQARRYQLDVLEQARTKNTIAFLETGAGKTLIAVLLIKSVYKDLLGQNKKMLAVFLVPKVPLVYQQAEVIRKQTGYQVGHYCGDMGQDFWDARRWQREFETKQVLVMTAQILLNILRHSIIKMEMINLLILDECHHAVKKHPYSLVMSEFYHTTTKDKRPSVFGMTASPVNLKGVSSQVDCAIKIRNLETKLDSIVCTIKDRKELEKHVPMPSEIVVEYDKAATMWSLHEKIKQMITAVEEAAQASSRRSKWQFMGARDAGAKEELRQVYGVSERTESDGAANLVHKLRAINYALAELGQWCAYKVAQSFLTALQNDERVNFQVDVKFQESFLSEVVSLLQCELSEGAASGKIVKVSELDNGNAQDRDNSDEIEEGELPDDHVVSGGEHVDVIIGAAVADGKVTPKVQSLIKILLKYQHTEDFRAIVFVERVVAALVLPKVLAELPSLGFIRCASLIGHNNSQEMRTSQMQDTISKFRDGQVTLLVATSVAEEGLDIRQCNVVIRFDLAKTVLAYIQSRGRARKPGSDYILMVERGNLSHAAFLRNARNSEETLRKEAIERTDLSHLKDTSRLISIDAVPGTVYKVETTGAMVSLNSAVGLIHFYCSQLPGDRYAILRPEFIMEKHEKPGGPTEYSCRLQLPCNAPFEILEGPICSSMRLAQQAVCLAACKKLHEMGVFTDMLLPDKGSGQDAEKADQDDEGEPLPGTARHREFYPEGVADVLKGEWILSGMDGCDSSKVFHLYMYAVKCVNSGSSKDPFLNQVSDFAVLFGNELDAEVLSMSMDLFIARAMITKASLAYRGSLDVTANQLASLKNFHVRLMSIVLDVDVEPSTTPWDPAKAYLFVPVVDNISVEPSKEINWDLVENITRTTAWNNPLQRARPDVYLGTNERTLGGDRREYGFGKLRHNIVFGQKYHPTYGIRGAVAPFDVVKASGLVPVRDALGKENCDLPEGRLMMADGYTVAKNLIGKIVTAAHSGKRFYVDSICYDMSAETSFPRKEGYLGPLEYSSYADYYKQKYGVDLKCRQQPLIKGRGVSYCKNLLSPRFEQTGESEAILDKTYYVFLPPEICVVHPLPGSLVRGAQRLPSIMRRVESMLLAVQLKDLINFPIPSSKILEALTAASCQETFCYERAELLGDAYLKWVVSRFLFLKYPQKHEGQLTRMRQQMVSNMILYQYALEKGLQSYIQADRFAPSRWAAPGVPPVFDEDTKDDDSSLFDEEKPVSEGNQVVTNHGFEDGEMEDGELESDLSSYRVLSSKTLADVVEALIGVYYVEGGKHAANHLMKWIGIHVEADPTEIEGTVKAANVPESVLKSVDFIAIERALNYKFTEKGLLVEALTHASRPSSGVSCYQRLEFVGDAVLDHLITRHLFFTYTSLPPGRLTDLRAAAVNNENFARVAVKHKLHLYLRHGSTALERQIRDFEKEVVNELMKPGFNSFGLGDCKAPKVLGDIVESIAGAIFLDSQKDTTVVWGVFEPLMQPMVTPETLPMHPVRELQERCQQQAEGLEYKASRSGNMATVEVFIDGVQVGMAHNPQKKMAQKLAARNALAVLKEKETKQKEKEKEKEKEKKEPKNGIVNQTFTRQTLNDICLRRNWPMPSYRCVKEGGPAHAKRFTFGVRVNTTDRGMTDECIGEPMPSVKKAKDSAALLLLQLLNQLYS
ncbi:PREDICTED: endoribonuclease Dicer homolog 1 isoform X2 [Tarenaya hassleriana]|uniref:endoribonuclease Dicer homolog 1 isoform X2 n=1 Tax=Tarenaya hassleriana TaxID=28532 RepID=UPI00053C6A7A|nr:PREDICTED: endoribonuclease Dicer homolog 1 isoform X2 [Tarenaya hassleriana]